ncbi:MAG: carbamoyltransferase HypF [Desulfurococcaceae archaeon TW002]
MPVLRLVIEGVVQGVGFRPFIHRLGLRLGVKGYLRNVGGSEVEVVVEGDYETLARFVNKLVSEKPLTARVEEIEIEVLDNAGNFRDFVILSSDVKAIKRSMIPPDFAICDDCLREVLNPLDRRYRYAFNSCAWCGPRFTMIYRVPYDRENTSMSKYRLCDECSREYSDVEDLRRYHAQGISCPEDGPRLWLTDNAGTLIESKDPIKEASRLIEEGAIVAIKGIGGYHIASLATDDDVVLKLRKRKERPTKPFAIMGLDTQVLRDIVVINEKAEELLRSPERPIVLLPKKEGSRVSKYVSPNMNVEGVFTAYTALHYLLLLDTSDKFLIMTSGNPRGQPMCVSEECVYGKLNKVVDYVLTHDREIVNRADDSVVRFTNEKPVLLRRGRGYAPTWIKIGSKLPKNVIAFGAELQSAGAVGFEDKVVLTQYIGDADDLDTLEDLSKYLRFLINNYRVDVSKSVVVIDKHPYYNSSRLGRFYALDQGLELLEVQHHYAHALATMADQKILGRPTIAVVMDGVGYGDDGAIWGGEVLVIREDLSYARVGSLSYLPFVGDESTYRPARYLASSLLTFMGPEEVKEVALKLGFERGLRGLDEIDMLHTLVRHGDYVRSSSTGRFLDAVSALLGVCYVRTYEGEPAITLEAFSRGGEVIKDLVEDFKVSYSDGAYVIDLVEFLSRTIEVLMNADLKARVKVSVGRTSQYGLGLALGRVVVKVIDSGYFEPDFIVLGGGAAVNDFLVSGIKDSLKELKIPILLPEKVPLNDGGIALGQVVSILST